MGLRDSFCPILVVLPPDSDGRNPLLSSAQGVRQGDPLGPLFFSLGIRDLLSDLQNTLGPERIVVAYLDDIFIFSASTDPLPEIQQFFAARISSLQLNITKCKSTTIEEIRENGLEVLGSCVGPKEAREGFLRREDRRRSLEARPSP